MARRYPATRLCGANKYMKSLIARVRVPLLALLCLQFSEAASAQWLQGEHDLMGTQGSVELWANDEAIARVTLQAVFDEIERLDLMMKPWYDASELARINREAGRKRLITTAEMIEVVEMSLHYSQLSEVPSISVLPPLDNITTIVRDIPPTTFA
ncbi:MAG: thiamine biosynthesis lipoprotein ApbE [Halioglobus sp.]